MNSVNLGGVEETLLIPLYGRAVETRKPRGLLSDPKAVEMVEAMEYDFARFDGSRDLFGCVLRTAILDGWVSSFLRSHPSGTVVEVGAGLNTRFERLDNGEAHWVDLDLPDAIALRRRFFDDTGRRRMLASSILDEGWVEVVRGLPSPHFFVAEASIIYLSEADALRALSMMSGSVERGYLATDTWETWILANQDKVRTLRNMDAPLTWACDDPKEIEDNGPGLAVRESRRFGEVPGALAPRLPIHYRLMLPLVARLSPSARAYRLNLFDIQPRGIQ